MRLHEIKGDVKRAKGYQTTDKTLAFIPLGMSLVHNDKGGFTIKKGEAIIEELENKTAVDAIYYFNKRVKNDYFKKEACEEANKES